MTPTASGRGIPVRFTEEEIRLFMDLLDTLKTRAIIGHLRMDSVFRAMSAVRWCDEMRVRFMDEKIKYELERDSKPATNQASTAPRDAR